MDTPPAISAFLDRALPVLRADPRLTAVLAGGSWLDGSLDQWSDIDLVLVAEDQSYDDVMRSREELAAGLGTFLSAFTGEHVGEPRLLVCLYDQPVLHVDLKFVRAGDLADRVEDPVVLWDRDGRADEALAAGHGQWPSPAPDWFEPRLWTWVHYALTKVGRGELLEAAAMVDEIRLFVLGPLAQRRAGVRMRGMRHLERDAPAEAARLAATVARPERTDVLRALRETVALYRDLRADAPPGRPSPAEQPVVALLEEMSAGP